ncbi:MAG: hypothetical protein P8X64_08730 [Anaerolineales bacterium]|jgi:hypothetical protein
MHCLRRMITGLTLAGVSLLFACSDAASPAVLPPPTATFTPSAIPTSAPSTTPAATHTPLPPFTAAWQGSPHADARALAFHFWDDAGRIPRDCARCHSTGGFLDYLGADGSQAGVTESPAATGSLIECDACHNDAALALSALRMPSGVELTVLDEPDAVCLPCHQGLAAGAQVDLATRSLAPNGLSPELEFLSVHFSPAAATLFGSEAGGGYEYPGRIYAGRLAHAPGYSTCTGCHDPHGLEIKLAECEACHLELNHPEDLETRLRVSTVDYDADGNTKEGVAGEIETLRLDLWRTIQAYAEISGHPIDYQPDRDPYFFDAAGGPFRAWTPVLLKAAYNLHFTAMDPGAFAHNPTYIMQLLYDSIQDLGGDILGLIRP